MQGSAPSQVGSGRGGSLDGSGFVFVRVSGLGGAGAGANALPRLEGLGRSFGPSHRQEWNGCRHML